MGLPGFTAAASLYRTDGQYRTAGGVGALAAKREIVAQHAALPRIVTGALSYECTPSGSACVCKGLLDCLIMGDDGKCKGKVVVCERDGRCVCF